MSDRARLPHVRTGIGYDVHRFAPKRKLILGGGRIPFKPCRLGHSDADVLSHAICDALLGAAALGDIGKHFPNTNRAYKSISSLKLLQAVGRILAVRKFAVVNIDATLVLQAPRVLKHSAKMRAHLARALGIKVSQVSVKATTNEHLGFVGRGEGCAAIAVATIVKDTKG